MDISPNTYLVTKDEPQKCDECQAIRESRHYAYYKRLRERTQDPSYFSEDFNERKEAELKTAQQSTSSINTFFEEFRISLFLEFLLYHMLYFMLLGPLAVPIINLRGKALSSNMSFTGNSISFYIQLANYLVFVVSILLFFTLSEQFQTSIKFEVEIVNLILASLSRCIIIACKYATFDPIKILVLRTTKLTKAQTDAELFLLGWRKQTLTVIHNQVYQCQRAFDIDPSLFFVQFMVDPEDKTHKQLNENDFELLKVRSTNEVCEAKPVPMGKEKLGQRFYFGYAILKYLIDSFRDETKAISVVINFFIFIFIIGRSLTPIALRIHDNQVNGTPVFSSGVEMFISVLSAVQVAFTFLMMSLQVSLGLIDIQRKVFMQKQLAFMISPRKLKNLDMKKTLPTINIFQNASMKGWTLIRRVCLEYGKGFNLRLQGIYSFLGVWVLACIVMLLLHYFKQITLQKPIIYQIYQDTVFSLLLFFPLIVAGAQVNEVFELHESILNSNKTIISDLNLVIAGIMNKSYVSQSYIYTKALERIADSAGQSNQQDQHVYLANLIRHQDFHIEELLFDKKHNPFTLFGIKVTFVMLQSAAVALTSLVATLLSQIIQK